MDGLQSCSTCDGKKIIRRIRAPGAQATKRRLSRMKASFQRTKNPSPGIFRGFAEENGGYGARNRASTWKIRAAYLPSVLYESGGNPIECPEALAGIPLQATVAGIL